MSNNRQTDVSVLHPAIRNEIAAIEAQLNQEGHRFKVFEAFRSPERQAYLYAQGRTRPGNIVTKARPWSSYHQYGLAADFVLQINGQWSWSTSGKNGRSWARLHEVALENGLEPLSWELPHIQLAGINIGDLRAGGFPPGGDEAWAEHLTAAIIGWRDQPSAPPAPAAAIMRPGLPGANIPDTITPSTTPMTTGSADMTTPFEQDLARPAVPAGAGGASASANNFPIAHAFVEKWEGGFVDHPSDPGGATNMGITLATLARWRQRTVTKADVRALSADEARQIFKAFYFDVINGDSLPLPVAVVTYNAAVLHGPGRAAKFLQQALNRQGLGNVEVDGAIGPLTLAAVAAANQRRVADDFTGIQEAYLRSLHHFPTFGRGWMNRVNDLRRTVASLDVQAPPLPSSVPPAVPVETVAQPSPQQQRPSDSLPQRPDLGSILGRVGELAELIRQRRSRRKAGPAGTVLESAAVSDAVETAGDDPLRIALALLGELRALEAGTSTVVATAAEKDTPLTPVNAALGETVGKTLDGKKTAIGIVGTLLTALLARDVTGGVPGTGTVLGTLAAAAPIAQPVTLAMTAWGVLGKVDKWMRGIRKPVT